MKQIFNFALLTLILFSCNKKQEKQLQKDNAVIEIVKSNRTIPTPIYGILVFSSEESWKNTTNTLLQYNEEQLISWRNGIANFKSLSQEYIDSDLRAEEGTGLSKCDRTESDELPDIPGEVYASILNHQGIVIVGNTIYKINNTDFWTTSIENIQNGNINWTNKEVHKFVTRATFKSMPISKVHFLNDDNGNAWPKSNGKVVRMEHTKYCYAVPPLWSESGTRVEMHRKSLLAGFIKITADKLEQSVSMGIFKDVSLLNGFSTTNLASPQFSNIVAINKNTSQVALWGTAGGVISLQFQEGSFFNTVKSTFKGATKTSVRND
jgi:hypothetical protein